MKICEKITITMEYRDQFEHRDPLADPKGALGFFSISYSFRKKFPK